SPTAIQTKRIRSNVKICLPDSRKKRPFRRQASMRNNELGTVWDMRRRRMEAGLSETRMLQPSMMARMWSNIDRVNRKLKPSRSGDWLVVTQGLSRVKERISDHGLDGKTMNSVKRSRYRSSVMGMRKKKRKRKRRNVYRRQSQSWREVERVTNHIFTKERKGQSSTVRSSTIIWDEPICMY